MSRIATIFLLLLAIGLAVFVGTTERWRSSPERTIQPGSPLFDFDPEDIPHIRITNGDQSFRIKREEGGWILETTTPDTANPEAVAAIFKTALSTPVLDRIDPSEIQDKQNLATYGVLKSTLQLDFKGDRPLSLLFGKVGADGNRTYVAFEKSNAVYLIPNDLAKLIAMPSDNFRDRRLVPIDPDRVRRIEIVRGSTTLELENKGRGWQIIKPLDAMANNEAVTALLQKWSDLRLASIDQSNKKTEASTSPVDQLSEIRFFSENLLEPSIISIGKPSPDGFFPVRLQHRNISGSAPPALAELITIDLDQLRDRTLARLNPDLVDLIRWNDGGTKTEIRRHEGRWSGAIEKFFQILAATKSSRYAPATPAELAAASLTPPPSRLEFLSVLSENTPEALAGEHPVLSLAIGTPQADSTIPVHIEGTPEIAFVPASFLNHLPAE
ncbi:MAG: hypothetical protein CAK85_02690 [Spartobacteria bacterium AMD-G5]|nr:MAG: hypothetical protein CAK85_02690 [Spartobacteria bacterium AMD-G5]